MRIGRVVHALQALPAGVTTVEAEDGVRSRVLSQDSTILQVMGLPSMMCAALVTRPTISASG